jgi:hypothetical protein
MKDRCKDMKCSVHSHLLTGEKVYLRKEIFWGVTQAERHATGDSPLIYKF